MEQATTSGGHDRIGDEPAPAGGAWPDAADRAEGWDATDGGAAVGGAGSGAAGATSADGSGGGGSGGDDGDATDGGAAVGGAGSGRGSSGGGGSSGDDGDATDGGAAVGGAGSGGAGATSAGGSGGGGSGGGRSGGGGSGGDDGDGGADVHERARQGVEHVQAAARELIQAARAALDVAEDMVNDPDALASLAGLVSGLGDMARRAAGGGWPPSGNPGPEPEDERQAKVERIRVT